MRVDDFILPRTIFLPWMVLVFSSLEICSCLVESSPGEFLCQIRRVEGVCGVRRSVVDRIGIRRVGGIFAGVSIRREVSSSYLLFEVLMNM